MLVVSSNTEKLKLGQSKDSFIQQICKKLSKEPITQHLKQIQNSFVLSEGILLHINKNELYNQKKIVIPQSHRENIVKIAHDENSILITHLQIIPSKNFIQGVTCFRNNFSKRLR